MVLIHTEACPTLRCRCAIRLIALLMYTTPVVLCQTYQNVSFDLNSTTLPAAYYGYDPVAFINGYQDSVQKDQQAHQKDEFETTAAYEERLKQLVSQNPFATNIYAFSVGASSVSYDADAQTFALEFKADPNPQSATYSYCLLRSGAEDMGHYQAENAFGATFTVQKSLSFKYTLWLEKTEGVPSCSATAVVPIGEAKLMKPQIRALLVVKPISPYADVSTDRTEPTFDRPIEDTINSGGIYANLLGVRFYVLSSGRVLGHCP